MQFMHERYISRSSWLCHTKLQHSAPKVGRSIADGLYGVVKFQNDERIYGVRCLHRAQPFYSLSLHSLEQ